MAQMKDHIFAEDTNGGYESFEFDERVVSVFDDMVSRSVPCYETIQDLLADLALAFHNGKPIYDVGCSTGTTLKRILERATSPIAVVGLDTSPQMLSTCQDNLSEL